MKDSLLCIDIGGPTKISLQTLEPHVTVSNEFVKTTVESLVYCYNRMT